MNWSSRKVRDTFIQYFLRHNLHPHVFVPSSSIIPKNDRTLAFVNAGMNQFKDAILGYSRPSHPKVVNSQKCLRINDLNLVGTDSYHHTFFEMLGNWSFSNYFKKEACAMAWDLLVNVYGLDPQRLYITYFSGGESLPPDRETKEIWEDIGVSSSRILPFGKDNFWSMAHVGPCGPSTEIHYDHRGSYNDPSKVNQDYGSVVEIWNLVFMQYNITERGKLERLPLAHVVDTGAGLERLTSVLNGKISNYDSDLFSPIFETIQQATDVAEYTGSFQSRLDTSYRILADHMRAVTVALSDGILPQTNHKIRRLLHRSISLIETEFLHTADSEIEVLDLLTEIVEVISATLAHVYPEMEKMKEETIEILEQELHKYIVTKRNRPTAHESLPRLLTVDYPALTRLKSSEIERVKNIGLVDGVTAFKWYDALGITEEATESFCSSLNIKFDKEGLRNETERVKKVFRDESAREAIHGEEKSFIKKIESFLSLYNPSTWGGVYEENCNTATEPKVCVEWLFDEYGNPVEEISRDESIYWTILNRTPFLPGTTNVSDIGSIKLQDCEVTISDVKQLPSGWILHRMTDAPEIGVCRKAIVLSYCLDQKRKEGRRIGLEVMDQLKDWLKLNYGVVRFNGEHVSSDYIKLQVTLLSGELNHTYIRKCEEYIRSNHLPVVLNKKDWKGNGVYELYLSTSEGANESLVYGQEVTNMMNDLKQLISASEVNYAAVRENLRDYIDNINLCLNQTEVLLPYEISIKVEKLITDAERHMDRNEVQYEIERISSKLREIGNSANSFFIAEVFESDVEFPSLLKITRVISRLPALVIIHSPSGYVQAKCTIPQNLASEEFRADVWMKFVVDELGRGVYQPPRGQDGKTSVNLKRIRIPNLAEKLSKGITAAREYASRYSKTSGKVSSDPLDHKALISKENE